MANALKMLSSSQHRPDVSRVRHRANKNMAQWNLHIWNCCLDCARKIQNRNADRLCSIPTLEKGSHPSESDDDLLRLGLRSDGSTRIPRSLLRDARVGRRSLGYLIRFLRQEYNSFRRRHDPRHYTSSDCTGRRSTSISVTRCTRGSGKFEF
jgi:hypothetical protein